MKNFSRWTISNDFWEQIEPLVPTTQRRSANTTYLRKPGGGRKPIPDRQVFEAILFILKSKTQWNKLPPRLGSPSAIHSRFKTWEEKGFFSSIWQADLAEHDEMNGIAWEWIPTEDQITGETNRSTSAEDMAKNQKPSEQRLQENKKRKWRPAGIHRRNR